MHFVDVFMQVVIPCVGTYAVVTMWLTVRDHSAEISELRRRVRDLEK